MLNKVKLENKIKGRVKEVYDIILERGWDMSNQEKLIEHIAADMESRIVLDEIATYQRYLDIGEGVSMKDMYYMEEARKLVQERGRS